MSHRAQPSEESLESVDWAGVVERIFSGDRAAFIELARLVTGHLAHWRAFDFRADWDDLVQEVVIAVVNATREGRIEDARALPGYVRQVTRFKFIDRLRLRQREASDVQPEAAAADAAWPRDPDELTPESRLALWQAVDHLPEKQRIAVVEVYARDKTYEQVERETGIPLGSLKRHLREGLRALRNALGDDL